MLLRLIGVATACIAVLAVPLPDPSPPQSDAETTAFSWGRDSLWRALEARFGEQRKAGCAGSDSSDAAAVSRWLDTLATGRFDPAAAVFDSLEMDWFGWAPVAAACPGRVGRYVERGRVLRELVKEESRHWDLEAPGARERLYRLLYGTRTAIEEVMLQQPGAVDPILRGRDEPSATPSAVVHSVRIHSGDMLVSRGGAPTSALIARGSDFPGNFSHVALVHVDSSGHVSVIEAHIENGVAIAGAERYLEDRKLRIMVLRPRADVPMMAGDPMLPHRAATLALQRARSGHIPYDFTMDYQDPSKLFCSEVASSVYREQGMTLWTRLSTISTPGLRRWLAGFGVTHFETQEPSDLEYDPQLAVVAEWRDPEALRDDHIDNAVIDVMLEGAEAGDDLGYPWYLLPVGRVMKAYSWVKVQAGSKGPVPEGMSAASALRNREFSAVQKAWAARVRARAEEIEKAQGYWPPYWELVRIAREVK
jgi:hypothetical protein